MTTDDKSKPFEIRKDILHLAKDILSENMHVQNEHVRLNSPSGAGKTPPKPTCFSTEDVIKEAEKLYAFVSKR